MEPFVSVMNVSDIRYVYIQVTNGRSPKINIIRHARGGWPAVCHQTIGQENGWALPSTCAVESYGKNERFGKLSKTAMLVLTIPHSNAAEERVFSMIRKNQTSFRPSLDPKEILSSLITIKMEVENRGEDKYSFPPTVIREAKSATRKYNRAHKTTYS